MAMNLNGDVEKFLTTLSLGADADRCPLFADSNRTTDRGQLIADSGRRTAL